MGNFEKFIRKGFRRAREPRITLNKAGIITFNASCVDEYVKDHGFAELYYDAQEKRIGIKLLNEQTEHLFKIQRSRNKRVVLVTARTFVEYYKIMPKETKSYPVRWDAREDMLIIDLRQ